MVSLMNSTVRYIVTGYDLSDLSDLPGCLPACPLRFFTFFLSSRDGKVFQRLRVVSFLRQRQWQRHFPLELMELVEAAAVLNCK